MSALLLLATLLLMTQPSPAGFPHQKHTRLFPVCEGCHVGIATGKAARIYPAAQECVTCHDGKHRAQVAWTARAPRATNLRFSHTAHRTASARNAQPPACGNCHGIGGKLTHMEIGAAQPGRCMSCHAKGGETHLAASMECARCHVPLVLASSMTPEDVARFPKPDWHDSNDFAAQHGRGSPVRNATCNVCHARETCERCHANADKLPQAVALERDPRVAALETGRPARYFAPISHSAQTWANSHAGEAANRTQWCANCHVQSSCSSCHQRGITARPVIARLPVRPAGAPGKAAVTRISRRVHEGDMIRTHGTRAAVSQAECTQCHTKEQCSSCHAGNDSKAFHDPDYSQRHAADVFSGSRQCQSCHSTETFCRSCHTGSGVAAGSGMNAAFHNGQPMWVLTHGQAARLGMEACAACHRQNDCMRCHSAAGGWGVNPHRAGFEGSRTAARSAASCRLCHLSNPLKGN